MNFEEFIRNGFQEALPVVDRMAGRKIIEELIHDMLESIEEDSDDTHISEIAVAHVQEVNRNLQELNMSWMRLRRDLFVSTDSQQKEDLLFKWWSKNSFHPISNRVRRYIKKHKPSLDACAELHTKRTHRAEQKLQFLLKFLANSHHLVDMGEVYRNSFVESAWEIANAPVSWQVRIAAISALENGFKQGVAASAALLRELIQMCNREEEFPFVRRAAIRALKVIDEENAQRIVSHIYASASSKENEESFLLRRILLEYIMKEMHQGEEIVTNALRRDPSAAVRQKAAMVLLSLRPQLPLEETIRISRDESAIVRASWTLILNDDTTSDAASNALRCAYWHLPYEKDTSILQASLRALAFWLYSTNSQMAMAISSQLEELSQELIENVSKIGLETHIWWALVAELADVLSEERLANAFMKLRDLASNTDEGKKFSINLEDMNVSATEFERIATLVASLDFGLFGRISQQNAKLMRGAKRSFTSWRLLHEIRNPAYDKRQGHSHLTGLKFYGNKWFMPAAMAEITRTRIPGERVYISNFGSWAPQIPGPTEAYNASRGNKSVIFAPGIRYELTPKNKRASAARMRILWDFGRIDGIRFNALRDGSKEAIEEYLDKFSNWSALDISMQSLGDVFERFFKNNLALPFVGVLRELLESSPEVGYFTSPVGNEMLHLAIFAGAVGAYMFGRGALRYARIRKWRAELPLCIGGWGSRGKSGTERLKAALFHGLGYQVFSKTTGTQAMFISSIPGLDPMEIPLFRPYEKATIFEQVTVLKQAYNMDAQVFLWECMALNPRYVQILSHDWMRDDFATVTNTYPDHEDIQGPTGYDVANTISLFLPKKSKAVSCEQQMFPVLKLRAAKNGTTLKTVSPALPELLPQEFLRRYPYLEHPLNIALLLTLCNELEIEEDLALVLSADHIVPDIGALKTYPAIDVNTRRLDFSNTMSANERAGFLASFSRLGFDKWDCTDNLNERVVLVVNNRADRPARSHVFAKVIVEDVSVNGVIVIGSAVNEFRELLMHYMDEFLERNKRPISESVESKRLWLAEMFRMIRINPEQATEWNKLIAKWSHVSESEVQQRLTACVSSMKEMASKAVNEAKLSIHLLDSMKKERRACIKKALEEMAPNWFEDTSHSDEIVSAATEELSIWALAQVLYETCTSNLKLSDDLAEAIRNLIRQIFYKRVVLIEDTSPTGRHMMLVSANFNPPHTFTHLVGTQNIKGAGLEFVKLWINIETVSQKVQQWKSPDPYTSNAAFGWLLNFGGFTEFDAPIVMEELLRRSGGDPNSLSVEESVLYQRLKSVSSNTKATASKQSKESELLKKLIKNTDNFIDFADSINRRRESDRVMEMLALNILSHREAVQLMDYINGKQAEGPLTYKLFFKQEPEEEERS